MRVWEFEDNKAMASDLVREQDFILRLRRMQRLGMSSLVLNFILNAIEALVRTKETLEATQQNLQDFARATSGVYFEMSNGDVFIVWEKPVAATQTAITSIESVLSAHGTDKSKFLLTYRMPDQYGPLRERANHYVDAARTHAGIQANAERIDETPGRLTAKNVDQIEHLLGEIDLRRYGRTQRIYRDSAEGWKAIGEEFFISFEDLRRERFPKLEVVSSEHFFLAICGILDQKLLTMMTASPDMLGRRAINLNLSIASIMGSIFTQFVRSIPSDQRSLITFELHRGDLLQDFTLTMSAIETLKHEGFGVAIDSITPDMAPYLNLDAFAVDAVKINVSKDRAFQLADPAIRKALTKIPSEKMIFFRCDNERALKAGREMGVTTFQGWLIDDSATKKG